MKTFQIQSTSLDQLQEDALVLLPIWQDQFSSASYPQSFITDQNLAIFDDEPFSGKSKDGLWLRKKQTNGKNPVYLFGLGKKEKADDYTVLSALAQTVRKVKSKASSFCLYLPTNMAEKIEQLAIAQVVQTIVSGLYAFEKYQQQEEEKTPITSFQLIVESSPDDLDKQIELGNQIGESMDICRDLVNEPANIIYPGSLAKQAKSLGDSYGFEVEIMSAEDADKLGMHAFLGVGQGSEHPSKLIVMRYQHPDAEKTWGLIGKGVTYDSGGYSIKPTSSMQTMKCDMGGAAATIATMCLLAKRKSPVSVIGVVAACENLISGKAYKPGDVVTSMSGKTIEVNNTDAEGRLTMADALTYAIQQEKVDCLIDVATLTGGKITAVGDEIIAVFSNEPAFANPLQVASERSGDLIHQMPLCQRYKRKTKSKIADLKNSAGLPSAMTAGLFLQAFVEDKPWIHIDIAGTAWLEEATELYTMGATGQPVGLLYHFLTNQSK